MIRRGFIVGLLAGLGGFLFPQKLKANDQWWEEKEIIFEGVSGTEYLWPKDRSICFACENSRPLEVPSFVVANSDSINNHLRSTIEAWRKHEQNKDCIPYIHLTRIRGKPNQISILISSEKHRVAMDLTTPVQAANRSHKDD